MEGLQAPFFCEVCGKRLPNRNVKKRKSLRCKEHTERPKIKKQLRLVSAKYTASCREARKHPNKPVRGIQSDDDIDTTPF
jgi:hypothetical protein